MIYRNAPRDASVVICLLWFYGFARFVMHNDRRSKTSFSYIRPPALPLRANKRCCKDKKLNRKFQTFDKENATNSKKTTGIVVKRVLNESQAKIFLGRSIDCLRTEHRNSPHGARNGLVASRILWTVFGGKKKKWKKQCDHFFHISKQLLFLKRIGRSHHLALLFIRTYSVRDRHPQW